MKSGLKLFFLVMSVTFLNTAAVLAKPESVTSQQLIGEWYMGTKAGFDCNMKIRSSTELIVQYGGCFHQGEPIRSGWVLDGDKIKLDSAELRKTLGAYLRIVRYKKNLVLVPERKQPNEGRHKYSYVHCF